MNSKLFISFVSLVLIVLFSTCKKYPENNLWFKNPRKFSIIGGYITAYKVNGIDSLSYLNKYYAPLIPNSYFPYNNIERDIKKRKICAI